MMKYLISILFLSITCYLNAQIQSDSVKVITTLEELFTACNSSGPEVEGEGVVVYDRVAPYIIYMGNDKERRWKTACDYNSTEDRKIVDQIGSRIKSLLDKYESYKTVKYMIQTEEEGKWFALFVNFSLEGEKDEQIIFAFLKIGDSFLLGDID